MVEAPKTAVYCSLHFGFPTQPENLLWMAVYNLSSLNFDKCKELQGKDVYLFPDLSKDGKAFELWSNKAKELCNLIPGTRFEVSDLLETLAPNELKEKGADIADVLIKQDWRNFKLKQPLPKPQAEPLPIFKSEKGENSEALKQSFFLCSEPITKDTTSYSLKQLQTMAIRHLNKTMLKNKAAAKANYMAAWANDMAAIINSAGFTQQQFLQTINI